MNVALPWWGGTTAVETAIVWALKNMSCFGNKRSWKVGGSGRSPRSTAWFKWPEAPGWR
jgi:hypothetical protein